jgi:hypothetical protein
MNMFHAGQRGGPRVLPTKMIEIRVGEEGSSYQVSFLTSEMSVLVCVFLISSPTGSPTSPPLAMREKNWVISHRHCWCGGRPSWLDMGGVRFSPADVDASSSDGVWYIFFFFSRGLYHLGALNEWTGWEFIGLPPAWEYLLLPRCFPKFWSKIDLRCFSSLFRFTWYMKPKKKWKTNGKLYLLECYLLVVANWRSLGHQYTS